MEQVGSILLPISEYASDTYGVGAMLDMTQAWARAIDTDMPLECFARDRNEAKAEKDRNAKDCAAALERANAEAARILKAAEDKAQRISRICADHARQAMKAMEAV
jgi:predicted solute-binding protein